MKLAATIVRFSRGSERPWRPGEWLAERSHSPCERRENGTKDREKRRQSCERDERRRESRSRSGERRSQDGESFIQDRAWLIPFGESLSPHW